MMARSSKLSMFPLWNLSYSALFSGTYHTTSLALVELFN
jgi:hypothetical protein